MTDPLSHSDLQKKNLDLGKRRPLLQKLVVVVCGPPRFAHIGPKGSPNAQLGWSMPHAKNEAGDGEQSSFFGEVPQPSAPLPFEAPPAGPSLLLLSLPAAPPPPDRPTFLSFFPLTVPKSGNQNRAKSCHCRWWRRLTGRERLREASLPKLLENLRTTEQWVGGALRWDLLRAQCGMWSIRFQCIISTLLEWDWPRGSVKPTGPAGQIAWMVRERETPNKRRHREASPGGRKVARGL